MSQKPYKRHEEKSEDQIQMENIKITLYRNENNGQDPEQDNLGEDGLSIVEKRPTEKQVKELWTDIDDLNDNIDVLKDKT